MSANESSPTKSAPSSLTPVEVTDDPPIPVDRRFEIASDNAEINGIVQRPTSATKTSRPSTGKRQSRVAPIDGNLYNCNQVFTLIKPARESILLFA